MDPVIRGSRIGLCYLALVCASALPVFTQAGQPRFDLDVNLALGGDNYGGIVIAADTRIYKSIRGGLCVYALSNLMTALLEANGLGAAYVGAKQVYDLRFDPLLFIGVALGDVERLSLSLDFTAGLDAFFAKEEINQPRYGISRSGTYAEVDLMTGLMTVLRWKFLKGVGADVFVSVPLAEPSPAVPLPINIDRLMFGFGCSLSL
jgi:hypothetical protein